ncbi:MAG: hypothetical protein ACRED0_01905 [Gammaproteobacteria bacterium]
MEAIDVQRLLSLQQRKTEQWHEVAFTVCTTGLLALVEEKLRALARGGQSAP